MEGAAGWLSVVVATATSYEVQLVSLAHARDVLTAEVVSSCPCAAPSALQFYCDCERGRGARNPACISLSHAATFAASRQVIYYHAPSRPAALGRSPLPSRATLPALRASCSVL